MILEILPPISVTKRLVEDRNYNGELQAINVMDPGHKAHICKG